MNRTIMILHLLVSISVARPIGENPSPIIKDQSFETDDLVPRSPDEIEDVLILVKKDDILTTSDISRIYNLLENKLGQIRSLKEEPENDGYKNAELTQQSRVAVKEKPTENVKADEQSDNTDEAEQLENRTANNEESELEGKIGITERLISNENMAPSGEERKTAEKNEETKSDNTSGRTTIQLEEKNYSTEAEDFQSKGSTKEKRKSEVTKDLKELKSTTGAFRAEDNDDYLENDSEIYEADSRRSEIVIKDQNKDSYQNARAEINDKSDDLKENSRNGNGNDKVKHDGKRAPIENSRSSYLRAKVKSINKQASKEDSRSGYGSDKAETNDKRAPKEESRSGYPNDEGDSYGKTASKDDEERKGYEMPINDESNSSWDLLDDIPISRRMLMHDNFDVEIKGKPANEDDEPEEDRNASEPIASRNENSYGSTTPQYDRTVSKPELQSTVPTPQYQSTIANPVQRTVLNPRFQKTIASQQIQTGWNPQFQSTVPHSQFQTTLNPQTRNIMFPNQQFESSVLNPQLPSTVLNPQFQIALNPQLQNTVTNRQFVSTVSNPQFPNTILNSQFQTSLNPQNQNTVPNRQFESIVLNPQFPSTVLNSQLQTVPNLQFRNSVSNPQFRNSVSIPHIHPSLLPVRRFIIPGIIKTRPAKPKDIRRLYNQEENNIHHQIKEHKTDRNTNENVNYRNDERSETEESREFNIEDNSNAYPYTPVELEKEKTPQIAMVNPIFSKLVEASEHPKRFNPNFNGGNVQIFPYNKLNRFQLF